ncbi:hypothetical protein ACJMK2_033015 [Sinanodonta woodiana]|uniref:guanylate cyclase n=1 Tax=Sinanodonta woodiana TaxID=1069815 RepID=A0ABD3X738_SINWO
MGLMETELEAWYQDPDRRHLPLDESRLFEITTKSADHMHIDHDKFLHYLGIEYLKLCLSEYGRSIRMMGSNIVEFLSNLDGLQEQISKSEKFLDQVPPSFRCEYDKNKVTLHFYMERRNLLHFYSGIISGLSEIVFLRDANVELSKTNNSSNTHHIFTIDAAVDSTKLQFQCRICNSQDSLSNNPADSKIGVKTFCKTFPYHIIFNRKLQITQLGVGLMKTIGKEVPSGEFLFTKYFRVVQPNIDPVTFSALLSRVNFCFTLDTKSCYRGADVLSQSIKPTKVDDVTMLFSDIVGFTAICSTCSPMTVINMLNSLYTHFDKYCDFLDVYKVETIGDAYCVAGGLHRPSKCHAQQIAWMALKMMEAAQAEKSHDGNVIKMRIGLHTGSVLAGVIGSKMPRYCLFGNNVTLANKFESGSEATRINVSPTTHSLLITTPGFRFTPRSRDCLPEGFPEKIAGTCHFLNTYIHPEARARKCDNISDHISMAVKFYKIKEN